MKNIDFEAVKKEFIECFNDTIIESGEETMVDCIDEELQVTNRGHGMLFRLKDNPEFAPVFYLEELLPDLQHKSLNQIIVEINDTITDLYENNIVNFKANLTISLEPDDEVIFTAVPTTMLPEGYIKEGIEMNNTNIFGLTIFMKTLIPNYPMRAYGHVRELTDNDDKEEIRQKAYRNTMRYANIAGQKVQGPNKDFPPLINLIDLNSFADYFYLVDKTLLKFVANDDNFSKIYVFPNSVYDVTLIGIPEGFEETSEFTTLLIKPMIENHYKENPPIGAFVYYPDEEVFSTINIM